jgi:hypothetical protein
MVMFSLVRGAGKMVFYARSLGERRGVSPPVQTGGLTPRRSPEE